MAAGQSLARPPNPDNFCGMLLRRSDDEMPDMIAGDISRADLIERLIVAADFDEHERDIGTSGLCGTFAIALLSVLESCGIRATPALAYIEPLPKDVMRLQWRHALVDVDGELFDIDGRVEPAHVLENYCWTSQLRDFHRVRIGQFSSLIKGTRNAFDAAWLAYWTDRLRNAELNTLSRSQAATICF